MRSGRTISRKGLTRENLGYFLTGFTEGEGSFNVSSRRKVDYQVNWQVVMSFNVSQKDPALLKVLQKTLKCGIIKVRRRDGLFSFDVTKPKDIIQKIIPYFKRYPLISGSKRRILQFFVELPI